MVHDISMNKARWRLEKYAPKAQHIRKTAFVSEPDAVTTRKRLFQTTTRCRMLGTS